MGEREGWEEGKANRAEQRENISASLPSWLALAVSEVIISVSGTRITLSFSCRAEQHLLKDTFIISHRD